ncbi:purine nucleoside transporter PunC [Shewanella psychrotolerans]|uniref:purine nucleoside transporter PunC n=1 Tax=Shewanella psychrotolerans TaxID=2864206 RepID=UPI001C656101|nr:purine nucleoside transporter PunC [Shewanella psychrotolerans]QYK03077.1 Bcr/CflA family multidrug efflux MFS transporter [Shewanella psychrotolerans]
MKFINKSGRLLFLGYLALLSMLGFVATDMYLPAFKSIEMTFDTSAAQVASSLTFFLAGLAIGQLLYGPLVQRYGKRVSLLIGLSLFGVASYTIAISDSMLMFNIGRFFQALGACSAAVIWQAIVIDKYDATEAQKVFSNIMPLVALSPALAPILGAYVLEHSEWRTIFIMLTALTVLLMLATVLWVKKEPVKLGGDDNHAVSYLDMFNSPKYLGNVIIFGACSAAFFSYLTLWPIVMEQHGYRATEIGLSFIPQTIMFIVGGYMSKVLIRKVGVEQSLTLLLLLFGLCVAGIAFSTLVLRSETIWPLLTIFSILAAANGACYPIVVNSALQVFKHASAKAAGLQNFLQIGMAFGASSLVAIWASQGEVTIALAIVVCSVGVLAGYRIRKLSNWKILTDELQTPDPANIALYRDKENKD